jgi:hypothetical protein
MRKVIPRGAAVAVLLILLPVAVASAGPYFTTGRAPDVGHAQPTG